MMNTKVERQGDHQKVSTQEEYPTRSSFTSHTSKRNYFHRRGKKDHHPYCSIHIDKRLLSGSEEGRGRRPPHNSFPQKTINFEKEIFRHQYMSGPRKRVPEIHRHHNPINLPMIGTMYSPLQFVPTTNLIKKTEIVTK